MVSDWGMFDLEYWGYIWTLSNLSLYGNTSATDGTHPPTGPIKHKETL